MSIRDDDNDFGESPRTQLLSGEDIELVEDDGLAETIAPPLTNDPVADEPFAGDELPANAGGAVEEEQAPFQSSPTSVPPPTPAEPPQPTVLDLAVEEAQAGGWPPIANALRAELDAETDKARAALVAYELGEVSERRLKDEPGAVKAYGRALQADPSLRPNLWAIRRVFYRRGLWPNLLKLIDAELRFARSDRERADLCVERALVLEDRAGDPSGARDALDRALALDPTHRLALLHRERTAIADGDQGTLARVWRALADATDAPARKVEYLVDLARLVAAQGGDAEGEALEILSEAAALGEGRDRVLRERHRLAEQAGDADAELAALEARVRVLEERFGPAGPGPAGPDEPRWPLDRGGQLRLEIVAMRRRQAQLCREREAHDEAWRFLEAALTVAPGEPLLLLDLAEVAETSGRWNDLAELCAGLAAREPDPARAARHLLGRADALARAGEDEAAEATLEQLIAAHPGFLPVLERRERGAFARADFAALAALRAAEGDAAAAGVAFGPGVAPAPDPAWAAAAYVAAGDLWAHFSDHDDDARAAYEKAHALRPGDPSAVEALVALHQRAGRLGDAVALLEGLAQAVTPGDARGDELLERIAAMREAAGDREGALAAWDALAGRRPDDPVIGARRERLLGLLGRHAERAALLAELAGKTSDPGARAALHHEVGRIAEVELDDPAAAAAAFEAALAADPDDRLSRGALAGLYWRAGRWDALAESRRLEAGTGDDAASRQALYDAAVLTERRLGRPDVAAELYGELAARFPEDGYALRGLVRTLAGDPAAQAEAIERETALAPPGAAAAQGLVRLGDVYTQAGRLEEAVTAYRRAQTEAVGPDAEGAPWAQAAAAHALWSLYELGARTGEAQLLSEGGVGLAQATRDAGLRLDLLEDLAWLPGEAAETASAYFDEVVAEAPDRRGAQLGRALAASRRKQPALLADALVAQAERTSDAVIAAALLMRAATLREAEGRGADAAQLAARALALTPDDTGALIAVAERPGLEPGQDAEADSARAELLGRRAQLAADSEVRAEVLVEQARLVAGAGQLAAAGALLAEALALVPDHLSGLELFREVARAAGDDETACRAALALGRAHRAPAHAARFIGEAAGLLEGALGRPRDAALAWREAYLLDPTHPKAWERAHALVREGGDAAALNDLLGRRLAELETSGDADASAWVPVLHERAQLAQRHGDDEAAAADLEALLLHDPQHAEALALLAEVRHAQGDAREAARLLDRYHDLVQEPELRAASELRLASILANDLGDLEGAVHSLEVVMAARPGDLAVRERLVELYAQVGSPNRAAEELERMVALRTSASEKARDELRAARTWRDAAGDPARAQRALDRAARLDPLDLDIVRERAANASGAARAQALRDGAAALRAALGERSTDASLFERLLAVAELAGDADLTFAAQGALVALGAASAEVKRKHAARRQELGAPRITRALSDEDWRSRIEHPGVRTPWTEVWAAIAESVSPGEPSQLGFGKPDRVAWKTVAQKAPAVDAVAKLFGLGELDLWVSPARAGVARVLIREVPIVLLGEDVARPRGAEQRLALARTLALVRTRTAALEEMTLAEVELSLASAVKTAGGDPARLGLTQGIPIAKLDDRTRQLTKAISRRDRKQLTHAVERLGAQPPPVDAWRLAMRVTAHRAALVVGGDVHAAALAAGAGRGGTLAADPVAADLIAWGVGETCLDLRQALGIS